MSNESTLNRIADSLERIARALEATPQRTPVYDVYDTDSLTSYCPTCQFYYVGTSHHCAV